MKQLIVPGSWIIEAVNVSKFLRTTIIYLSFRFELQLEERNFFYMKFKKLVLLVAYLFETLYFDAICTLFGKSSASYWDLEAVCFY